MKGGEKKREEIRNGNGELRLRMRASLERSRPLVTVFPRSIRCTLFLLIFFFLSVRLSPKIETFRETRPRMPFVEARIPVCCVFA